jgi:precorrin-6B methylase 2
LRRANDGIAGRNIIEMDMTDFKHPRFPQWLEDILLIVIALALAVGLPLASPVGSLLRAHTQVAAPQPNARYEVRANHDPNGTGRFYLGREIAQVMGAGGIPWLDRPEREGQEQPEVVIEAMSLRGGEVIADLGAGSGYFTFRLAAKVGSTGKVLAVDIQDEMLETLRQRAAANGTTNVEEVKAGETDPHLPAGGVDLVLMVDVYHELAYPYEVMTRVHVALKPGGRVVFVEYRKEDASVPIKEVHKMSVEQLTKEMKTVGLARVRTVETLPSQHIVIFEKRS